MSGAQATARALAGGAVTALEGRYRHLNDINVYPRPDGDTGTNMLDTARALLEAIEEADGAGREALARVATRSVLMGARGNSGVILSQMVRGLAQELAGEEPVDAALVARALRAASDCAYRAVRHPVEGTMLTAVRAMAEEAEAAAAERLDEQLDRVLAAGERAVAESPQLLDMLGEAGVVDAGAEGLVELARGALAGVRAGVPALAPPPPPADLAAAAAVHEEESAFRYCTSFLVEGDGFDPAALEASLEALGDCLLVVGDRPQYKVHVHTDDPAAVLALALGAGTIDGVEVANMDRQVEERRRRLQVIEGGRGGDVDGGGLVPEPARAAERDPRRRAPRPGDLMRALDTAIVLDSTADVPDPRALHSNWRMVPLTVRFGGERFHDHATITAADFYRRLASEPHLPTTAAPGPGEWEAAFEELDAYRTLLVLPVSAAVSGSAGSAEAAARALDPEGRRISVLDTRTVSSGIVLLAEGLQRRLEQGVRRHELELWFEDARRRMRILIYVETLEFLERGGRIGRARALLGNVLGARPLLTLEDGEIAAYRTVRGPVRAAAEFERFLREAAPERGPARIGLAHAGNPEAVERLQAMVRELRPQASIDRVAEIGAVVGTYAGPGAYGMIVLSGE
jgi:DegV family protein with EDD domain